MQRMTKNEFKKYMEECANKVWTEPGYTMERYNADLDAVEILPLDLSKFPQLSEKTIKWINALFEEEDTDCDGNYMLRGFTRRDAEEVRVLQCSYGNYSNGYSFFAYNENEYLIYTYCEGDTTLTIYPDKESYDKGYKKTHDWYKEEYA